MRFGNKIARDTKLKKIPIDSNSTAKLAGSARLREFLETQ